MQVAATTPAASFGFLVRSEGVAVLWRLLDDNPYLSPWPPRLQAALIEPLEDRFRRLFPRHIKHQGVAAGLDLSKRRAMIMRGASRHRMVDNAVSVRRDHERGDFCSPCGYDDARNLRLRQRARALRPHEGGIMGDSSC